MNRIISLALAMSIIGGGLFSGGSSAKAENGQIATGVVGGLIGGALLGGVLAGRPTYAAPPQVYYAPAPVYVEEPICRIVRQRYWDGYGYRLRRVQVCD